MTAILEIPDKYKMMSIPKLEEELKNIQKNMAKLGKKIPSLKPKNRTKALSDYEELQKAEELVKKLLDQDAKFEETNTRSIVPIRSTAVPTDIEDEKPTKIDMNKPIIGMTDIFDEETEAPTEVLKPTRQEFLINRYPAIKREDVAKMSKMDIKREISKMEHLREIVLLDISRADLDINSRITLAQNLDTIDKNITMLKK